MRLLYLLQIDYDGAVLRSSNDTRLCPLDNAVQRCDSFRITTTPESVPAVSRDRFGNAVHSFEVITEHRQLLLEAEAFVTLANSTSAGQGSKTDIPQEPTYLCPSVLVPFTPEISELARVAEEESDGSPAGFVQAAKELVRSRFRYVRGLTSVKSSLHEVLRNRAGVCQDFAHLLLAVARTHGLPARYVSGYLLPESLLSGTQRAEGEFSRVPGHAWVEVSLPGSGWMSFDPTLKTPSFEATLPNRHISLAHGADYSDVAPFRGTFTGPPGSHLSVEVQIYRLKSADGQI